MKRIFYISLAAVLLLTALVSGKLGYETMQSGEYSQEMQVFTTQAQTDGTKPLVKFNITKSEKMVLYPLDSEKNPQNEDAYVKYEINAENICDVAMYIRFYVAIPSALDKKDGQMIPALHMDWNNTYYDISGPLKTTIKGMEYNVYALTYVTQLDKDATTPAAVYGFYLDKEVNLKGSKIYYGGKYTGFENDEVRVYSVVHAYQLESESGIDDIPVTVPTFYDEEGKEIK